MSSGRQGIDRFWIGPMIGVGLLILLGIGLWILAHRPVKAQPSDNLFSFSAQQVSSLTFTSKGKTLSLYQNIASDGSTSWSIGSPQGSGADESLVQSFVDNLTALAPTRTLTTVPTVDDLKSYGLSPVTASVVITLGDGSKHELDVGIASPIGDYYAQIKGNATVYLLDGFVPSEISADPSAWLPPPSTSSGSSASATGGGSSSAAAPSPSAS